VRDGELLRFCDLVLATFTGWAQCGWRVRRNQTDRSRDGAMGGRRNLASMNSRTR
jgi:hypothetical protein